MPRATPWTLCLGIPAALIGGWSGARGGGQAGADEVAGAARELLASFSERQREQAVYPFAGAERRNWDYVPKERAGAWLGEMTPAQSVLVQRLLRASLSAGGYFQAEAVRRLDDVLHDLVARAGGNAAIRSSDLYTVALFGEPGTERPWAWRFEGHHLSLNFTALGATELACSPRFLGANPALVADGKFAGLEALAEESRLAVELFQSLSAAQQEAARVESGVPRDILYRPGRALPEGDPAGLAGAALNAAQRALFLRLIGHYVLDGRLDRGAEQLQGRAAAELDATRLAWAGGATLDAPRYYRIHGPSLLIEYLTAPGDVNHLHTSFRELRRDFGGTAAED